MTIQDDYDRIMGEAEQRFGPELFALFDLVAECERILAACPEPLPVIITSDRTWPHE